MPFHHHHHRQDQHSSSSCYCNTSSCCNCSCYSNSNSNLPNSQSQISDQLLQTLTTHLLLQSQQPQILLKPNSHFNQHHHHHKDDQQQQQHQQSLIQSLLRRVAALESSLSNLSTYRLGRQKEFSSEKHSIKHLAAVTIQRHFRRLLARRSRTLRDLKLLASIKSQAASLRSFVSAKSLKNPRAISKEAMNLLFQLDSIKSSDAMIREGKGVISKELVRISEFVNKALLREDEDEVDGLLRRREKGRRVSFAENDDEGRGFGESSSDEEEDTRLRNRRFYSRFSDGEESPKDRRNIVNGGSGLAAPLPVQMEPRRNGLTKKVVIDED